jgi:hypothetical protein
MGRGWAVQLTRAQGSAPLTIEGVAADPHHRALPQAMLRCLEHSLIRQRACDIEPLPSQFLLSNRCLQVGHTPNRRNSLWQQEGIRPHIIH